jgi:hypothetical protein
MEVEYGSNPYESSVEIHMKKIREVVGSIVFFVVWNNIFMANAIAYWVGSRLGFKYKQSCGGLMYRIK